MDVTIKGQPAFSHMHVSMDAGETIIAESGAMASMSSNVLMKTRFNGGFIRGLGKRFFGGESLFINSFTSEAGPGELVITQPTPGDIQCIELDNNTLYLQPGAYLASDKGVKLGMGWAGFRSFIGREGLFRLKVSGKGRIWFGGYGGIVIKEITDEYVIDTSHLIAYEPSISLRVGMAGGIFSSLFSGEGLVTRVKGPGRVYIQSRSMSGLAQWTNAHIF